MLLVDDTNTDTLQGIAEMSKATYPSITPDNIKDLKVYIPMNMEGCFEVINKQLQCVCDTIHIKHTENKKLTELQSLLLTKMGE